jgi:hypothetical protein
MLGRFVSRQAFTRLIVHPICRCLKPCPDDVSRLTACGFGSYFGFNSWGIVACTLVGIDLLEHVLMVLTRFFHVTLRDAVQQLYGVFILVMLSLAAVDLSPAHQPVAPP